MATIGNEILYISLAVSALALIGLLIKELKNIDLLTRFVTPAIFVVAGLLTFAYLLLTYYFVVSDFTYEYVWSWSSRDLPLVYKISGTWAGQPGTYLLWVWVIFLASAWLAKTTWHSTPLTRRTQIITVLVGLYFIILTLIQTPFKSIYEGRPDLIGYVPPDGNGLNAQLVNFWMVIHPPLMFIGYAAVTIPFAAAVVYLLTKEEGWEELSRQWSRFAWLFLGMGIAVGGVWAYFVLSWGGFWAWDPVETASFIPWLTLTGFLHAAALHRKNKKTFSIAAPVMASVSFILVLYAALVVRSGNLFNTVHAFGDTSTGSLLILSILITSLVTIVLAMRRYLGEPETAEEDWSLWSKRNIFYVSLLLFVILAFISFWGITFPAFIQLTQNLKVGVASDTKNFFNIWSYPFTIILLLALGFCLNYKESEKEKQKKTLFIVAALTVIAMLPRTENFLVLDHSSPFYVREPTLYKLIGSISLLSIFPPLAYAAAEIYRRLMDYMRLGSIRPKIKGTGLAFVHFGVVFILFGAVISSSFTYTDSTINIPLAAKGQLLDIGNGYSMKIVDFSTRSLTETNYPGMPIGEVLANPSAFEENTVRISGSVADSKSLEGHGTLVELTDNSGSMWIVFQENVTAPKGIGLTVSGRIMSGFEVPVLNVISAEEIAAGQYRVQSLELEVFKDDRKIGSGAAEFLEKGSGYASFPLVSPSVSLLAGDVYVVFNGVGSGVFPLTLKIIPAVNFAWIGIILFAVGIILIMAVKTKSKGE